MRQTAAQRGNVLILVLIAAALFAALSFAVTKDWGTSSNMAAQEQARTYAAEMIQFGNNLRVAVDKMMLLGGVAELNGSGNGLLFSAPGANAAYGVAGAQPATEIFNPAGGKVAYLSPQPGACASACAYEFSGQYTVTGVGDDAKPELVMLVANVSKHVCETINATTNPSWTSVPTGGALTLDRFDGTAFGGGNAITLTGGGNEFVGKRSFCYKESAGAGRYIFVHVLRAR